MGQEGHTEESFSDIIREMREHASGSASDAWYDMKGWEELCLRLERAHERESVLK